MAVALPSGEPPPAGDARRHEYEGPVEVEVEAADVEVEATRLGDERRRAETGELMPTPAAARCVSRVKLRRKKSVLRRVQHRTQFRPLAAL